MEAKQKIFEYWFWKAIWRINNTAALIAEREIHHLQAQFNVAQKEETINCSYDWFLARDGLCRSPGDGFSFEKVRTLYWCDVKWPKLMWPPCHCSNGAPCPQRIGSLELKYLVKMNVVTWHPQVLLCKHEWKRPACTALPLHLSAGRLGDRGGTELAAGPICQSL